MFSVISLCRIVWEAAGTATWLNCAGHPPDEILKRSIWLTYGHLCDDIKSAKASLDWSRLSDEEQKVISEEILCREKSRKMLEAVAQHLGMSIKRIKQRPSAEERLKAMMDALRSANPGMSLPPDRAMLTMLNGAIHSDPNTLLGLLDSDAPESMEGARTVSVRSRLQPVLWHAVAPAVMMLKTANHWWDTGLDIDHVEDHADSLNSVIREAVSESSP